MNRRGFISLLAGAAGAPLVPWRGIVEPVIFLPGRAASGPYQYRWNWLSGEDVILAPAYRWSIAGYDGVEELLGGHAVPLVDLDDSSIVISTWDIA